MWRRDEQITVWDFPKKYGGLTRPGRGKDIYVSTYDGQDGRTGRDWSRGLATMAQALDIAGTHDRIYFVGKIAEQLTIADTVLTDLNLKFDVTIIGCGSLHHADQPGSGSNLYDYGASVWQSAGTPETTTPLLAVYGRGWGFNNILFDCPVDAAALQFSNGEGDGLTEYSASHYSVLDCDFRSGLYGIQDKGGCFNGLIQGNIFETLDATSSGCAIIATNVSNAWRRHRILDNFFQPDSTTEGNERHIVGAFNAALIKGNTFGTVKGTGKYIDLTGGAANVVTENVLGGLYDTTDYVSGTGDLWYQNWSVVKATTSPDGTTILPPAA